MLNISLYSYGSAFLAYALLSILLVLAWRNRPFSAPVLAASVLTALWASVVALGTLRPRPPVELIQLAEISRNASWIFLLLKVIANRVGDSSHWMASGRWLPHYIAATAVVAVIVLGLPRLSPGLPLEILNTVIFAIWLVMAVLGLVLLEQILRNSSEAERWHVKYLCFGLGVIFAYDFFMYAEALLFRNLDATMWQARGLVAALSAAPLAVAIARNTEWQLGIQVSRHVVFHSVTLLAAGIYLIAMAMAGYFIRFLGGSWGGVLQISFLVAAGLLLLALLFSGQLRARTRVWLSKHFFSYKYDYRNEWLGFTGTLADTEENVPQRIIQAIAALTSSPSGLLWARDEEGGFRFLAHWEMPSPDRAGDLQALADWLERTEWIIDLREWRRDPDRYGGLDIPGPIADIERAWLIVPLMFRLRLQGILLLRQSDLQRELNWEDRDLLKVAGRQAASHLAQHQANEALVEARQFEAFNRLSAYVIHDLKNILAQQSLIVSNAEKHKRNPEFVDDVIDTVRNSVDRMTRLMSQMRAGVRGTQTTKLELQPLLEQVVGQHSANPPRPLFRGCSRPLFVAADHDQLLTVFGHILQNAREASDPDGNVEVRLLPSPGQAVVEIEDSGSGMDPEFVRDNLFQPFHSTKGLTGMGIGAFESREFVRSIGGDIQVRSTPGVGSLFTIVLPCVEPDSQGHAEPAP